ncbi:MAG: hypothetical protein EZS28_009204 [Streblomastix strix]|uniref:Uncharacterized protein n=1 Tax=Streblomastix strix TaxID=222440 RepID=A0A5J4WJS3_9EUKA|nr:MAG: hypothetical protein EZS28_009204 [Streblomastix strix]
MEVRLDVHLDGSEAIILCYCIVSVGTSRFIIVIVLLKQPFHKFLSNYLTIFLWSHFVRKKWHLTSERRPLSDIEKELMKKNATQKFGALFDLDPLSGQNHNQPIHSPLFVQQRNRSTTRKYKSEIKECVTKTSQNEESR